MKRQGLVMLIAVVTAGFFTLIGGEAQGAAGPKKSSAPSAKGQENADDWRKRWEDTVAAAKKEGEVTVYFIGTPNARETITKGFKNRFGINVNFVVGTPAEIVQKLDSESKAGLHYADAINLGGGSSLTMLKPKGLLKPLEPELILPEVKDPKAWRIGKLPFIDKDGTVFGMLASYERYAAINTDEIKENEITSLKGLVDPKWKNRMIMLDPSVPGPGLSACTFLGRLWGMDKTLEWMQGISDLGTIFTRDKRQHIEWVAKGSKAIAIAPTQDILSNFMSLGARLSSVRIAEGGLASTVAGAIMLPAKPAHPNASIVFVNWLLSREGHAAYVKGMGLPGARVDAPQEGIDELLSPGPGEKITVNGDEEFFLLQAKLRPGIAKIVQAQAKY